MDEMDLDELKAMFLEEATEHVDTLERGLLEMSNNEQSPDLLNEVFRAAHSIKGGGATFGFADLAELTHHMETLLDEIRSGAKPILESDIELLLQGLDMVRELMDSLGNEDHPDRVALQEKLQKAVSGEATPTEGSDAEDSQEEEAGSHRALGAGWDIVFKPKPELFQRGNDPLLIIRELKECGELQIEIDSTWLPEWEFLDPKVCYMPWKVALETLCEEEQVREVFDWVEFDCDLSLSRREGNKPDEEPVEEKAEDSTKVDSTEDTPEAKSADKEGAQTDSPEPAKEKAPAKSSAPAKAARPAANAEASSIRVSTDKVDQLINIVGELVITQSMLSSLTTSEDATSEEKLRERLSELERNTRQLQESVMRVRMLPLSMGFGRLPRLVRDLSKKLDKNIELVVEGAETEIDKTVLEQMMDPLVHLVRNSVDHGLETPEEREAAAKPATGILKLSAYHRSGSVVIEITDDGRGINTEKVREKAIERGVIGKDDVLAPNDINQLIFAPGFSTAETVSDVSGRGVGMDVVRRNILDLGGRVELDSEQGVGTTVTIRLPLTLAILDGQLVSCAGEAFVVPLSCIIETLELGDCEVSELPGTGSVFSFRERYLPLVDLRETFSLESDDDSGLVVVIDTHGQLFGLMIDEVLGQQQIVIKSLEDNYKAVAGIAGATIMSDGSVALIIDPQALLPKVKISRAA